MSTPLLHSRRRQTTSSARFNQPRSQRRSVPDPDCRELVVDRARRRLAQGHYDNPAVLDATVEKLLAELG